MCRVTVGETAADEALQRLQQELQQLQLQQTGQCSSVPDFRGIPGCKGSGPRLFCGHVPKEATEDLVRAHFSRWGTVTDVYFPRHKKTLKRRPFCFVSFASIEAAERALAESPLNICGIPIKNLTMVEDRDAYYRTKHANTRAALVQALQSIGNSPNGQLGSDQFSNLAALLAMEGVTADAIMALLPQGNAMPTPQMTGLLPGADRFSTGSMPDAYPSILNSDVPCTAALRMSTGAYNAFPSMDGRMPQQDMGFNSGGMGFGNPQALDLQLQQALLTQRMSLQPATAQGQAPINAALLQQYGVPQMRTSGFESQVPQYGPPPQYNTMQNQLFSGVNNWAAVGGQQPLGTTTGPLAGAPSSLAMHGLGLARSGPVQQTSNSQSSLEDALAALSTLKAAQGSGVAGTDITRPSAEILAGLGSTSTFSAGSPALSASPVRSSSPPSDDTVPSRTPGLELPNTGIWASTSK